MQKLGDRHLVDLRPVETLPAAQQIARVLVLSPAELVASKVIAYYQRRGKPKAGTDWRDLAMLLLTFPELKADSGAVMDCLRTANVNAALLTVWQEFVAQDIQELKMKTNFERSLSLSVLAPFQRMPRKHPGRCTSSGRCERLRGRVGVCPDRSAIARREPSCVR